MRVVQAVGWYFPTTIGGTEIYVSELSRRLRASGHDVMIAAPDAAADVERTYDIDGVPVYRYPVPSVPTRAESQGRSPVRGAERCHAWLRQARPDVVHAHTFVTGLGLAELRVAKSLGARVVATTHAASLGFTCLRGTMMRWGSTLCDGITGSKCASCYLQHRGLARPAARLASAAPVALSRIGRHLPGPAGAVAGVRALVDHHQRMQREMLLTVDRFVVLTAWAKAVLVANGAPPERITVNRLGVRFPPLARSRPAAREPVVSFLGRLESIKGAHVFAQAIGLLPPDARIRFELHAPARSQADLAVVTALRAMAGSRAVVTFGGELDADGVRALLERTDVLCCPSLAVEGGPTVALEANAAGVPVIGSDLPGLSEIVTDGVTGRLVMPGDARALARAFEEVAADPGVIDRWRRALPPARTMDDVAREYEALYTS